jgi:hypothetical protein
MDLSSWAEYTARHGSRAKILKRQAPASQSRNITDDFVANWPAFSVSAL